jgi:hypothetical protein
VHPFSKPHVFPIENEHRTPSATQYGVLKKLLPLTVLVLFLLHRAAVRLPSIRTAVDAPVMHIKKSFQKKRQVFFENVLTMH